MLRISMSLIIVFKTIITTDDPHSWLVKFAVKQLMYVALQSIVYFIDDFIKHFIK